MSQARKLNIAPFRQANHMDLNAARNMWESLSRAIDEIYNQNNSKLSFEESYRYGYNLVMQKHGDLLYEGLKTTLLKHLGVSSGIIAGTHNEQLLEIVAIEWSKHTVAFNLIKDILMYVDKSYCGQKKKPSVRELALNLFRESIICFDNTMPRIRLELLQNVHLERDGCMIDRTIMKNVVSMLLSLFHGGATVYEEEFESFFLAETEVFYQRESLQYLSSNPCAEYIRKVEARLKEEHERIANFIPSLTESKLKVILEQELIVRHAQTLMDMESSGIFVMLGDNRTEDLKLLYNLFHRVPNCLEMMRENLGKYIVQCGVDILANPDAAKDPIIFVKRILDLKAKFDVIIKEAMRSDKKMLKQLKDSFENFLNKDNRCASYLANYVDELLRNTGQTEGEMEGQSDQAITIFKYLADKDIFESYYRKLLSKRLLNNKSSSDEGEKSMLSRLKAECGYQFTSKLEGMLLDMNISKTVMDGYRACITSTGLPLGIIDMEVLMLTTGYWPLTPSPSTRLPLAVSHSMAHFRAYYLDKNNGRRLTWFTSAGSVDMKANFPGGKRELNVSFYQMSILLLFNEKEALTLDEIAQHTEIPELELKQHLLSLCTPKLKILNKSSKGKCLESNESFSFNGDFNSKFKRIKVPLIAMKEVMPVEELTQDNVPALVEEDRRHLVEAAIVRIMKSRKTLSHLELVAEVTRQLTFRFVPNPQFIKKRIESLIEREYLKRHEDDARLYNYLA